MDKYYIYQTLDCATLRHLLQVHYVPHTIYEDGDGKIHIHTDLKYNLMVFAPFFYNYKPVNITILSV